MCASTLSGFSEDTIPEIQRCHLSSVVLQLLALGVSNVMTFDFMSPPPQDSMLGAVEQLYLLGAVKEEDSKEEDPNSRKNDDAIILPVIREQARARVLLSSSKKDKDDIVEDEEDYSLQLTPLGQTMAHFPLDPFLARAIITSPEHGCVQEVLSVVAMLSVG